MNKNDKIILPGGAGLVGQNLVVQLKKQGYSNLIVIDKHAALGFDSLKNQQKSALMGAASP